MGTNKSDYANGVAIDSSNNVYITGYTYGSLDTNATNAGEVDAFLAKYDSSGNKQWTRQLGTNTSDYANGVAIDSNNNVYITGYTSGSLDTNATAGGVDAFLVKYDSSGNKQWTRQLGTNKSDYANGVAIDSSNNVYITGYTYGSLDTNATNAGEVDAFLAKYDSSGNKQWTRQLGTNTSDYANGVAIDSNNNVYITGYTSGSLDTNATAGGVDAFLVKYTPPKPPTLSYFSNITKTFGDIQFQISAPTTNSNGAFTYTSANTAVATISGSTVTIRSAGTSLITASQAATETYTSGTITATLTVSAATLTTIYMPKTGRNTDQSSDAIKRIISRRVNSKDRDRKVLDCDVRTRMIAMNAVLSTFPNRGTSK